MAKTKMSLLATQRLSLWLPKNFNWLEADLLSQCSPLRHWKNLWALTLSQRTLDPSKIKKSSRQQRAHLPRFLKEGTLLLSCQWMTLSKLSLLQPSRLIFPWISKMQLRSTIFWNALSETLRPTSKDMTVTLNFFHSDLLMRIPSQSNKSAAISPCLLSLKRSWASFNAVLVHWWLKRRT